MRRITRSRASSSSEGLAVIPCRGNGEYWNCSGSGHNLGAAVERTDTPHSLSTRIESVIALRPRRRQRKLSSVMTRSTATLFLLQLLACLCIVAAQSSGGRVTNNSEDAAAGNRVRIHEFRLALAETPTALSSTQVDEIKEVAEATLFGGLQRKLTQFEIALDYLLLQDIETNVFSTGPLRKLLSSTTLQFGGGVASFTGGGAPSKAQLEGWIAQMLEDDLPAALRNAHSEAFAAVASASYISLTDSPTPAPNTVAGGVQQNEENTGNDANIPLIIGLVAGLLLVGAGFALLLFRRRTRVATTNLKEGKDDRTNVNASCDVADRYNGSMEESLDGSDFTLSTTDHTLRSMATRRFAPRSDLYETESFEHDRKVSLHKDILLVSPAWLAESSANRRDSHNTVTNNTVLVPSHFVASDSDLDSQLTLDDADVESTASPFLFQGDQGEEVYLMPAPRARSRHDSKLVSYELERIDENISDPIEL